MRFGKKLRVAFLGVLLMLVFALPANAYLDPSVMTYSIQVVAGVVIAIGAVIGIYWRKMRKKVSDKLGIDENAKKEVEEDIVAFTEEKK